MFLGPFWLTCKKVDQSSVGRYFQFFLTFFTFRFSPLSLVSGTHRKRKTPKYGKNSRPSGGVEHRKNFQPRAHRYQDIWGQTLTFWPHLRTNWKWKRWLSPIVDGGGGVPRSIIPENFAKFRRRVPELFAKNLWHFFARGRRRNPAKIRFWKAVQPKPEVEFGRKRGNWLSAPGFLFEFLFIIGPISNRFRSTPRGFYHYAIVKATGQSIFRQVHIAPYWTGSQVWPFLEKAFRNLIPWYLAV